MSEPKARQATADKRLTAAAGLSWASSSGQFALPAWGVSAGLHALALLAVGAGMASDVATPEAASASPSALRMSLPPPPGIDQGGPLSVNWIGFDDPTEHTAEREFLTDQAALTRTQVGVAQPTQAAASAPAPPASRPQTTPVEEVAAAAPPPVVVAGDLPEPTTETPLLLPLVDEAVPEVVGPVTLAGSVPETVPEVVAEAEPAETKSVQ
ncbi:MAG: hypothetical protein AAF747_11575, partial [Planctomycetota bacterium]